VSGQPNRQPDQSPTLPLELTALFMSVSLGLGHDQAQAALEQSLARRGVTVSGHHRDSVDYLRAPERFVTVDLYAFELQYAPWLYRAFYHFTDLDHPVNFISQAFTWTGLPQFQRDLAQLRPQVVVSTYWGPAAVAASARRRGAAPFLNALIVTDYAAHRHWVQPDADLVMVAADDTRGQLLARGLDPTKVVVTGIPISTRFAPLVGADKVALRQRFGLRPDVPLILVSGGGTGSYRALQPVLRELSNLGRRVQVLILAGAERGGIEQLGGATLHHIGYTDHFPELLAASDLVVGKAGGLTVAEATALGVPLVIYDPIPGHEEGNAEFLERQGAGVWARKARDLRRVVLGALDPEQHAELSRNAFRVGRPDSADRVAVAILGALERHGGFL
jgi:processive 1,2-diacylglycerol beta-glucosyltransferase